MFSQLNVYGYGLFQGTIIFDFIGGFIPKELYKAVAEVLAYVYRLKKAAMIHV